MSNNTTPAPASALPFLFGGFTIPAGCRRIFITAQLEPSNGDPRIQPTGFPDIGPVLYPDPAETNGLICLIESEASMANWLEEVCVADKYVGALKPAFAGLPYIRLTDTGLANGVFKTSSTIDGHRFASEYIMGAKGRLSGNGADEQHEVDSKHRLLTTWRWLNSSRHDSGCLQAIRAQRQTSLRFIAWRWNMTRSRCCMASRFR